MLDMGGLAAKDELSIAVLLCRAKGGLPHLRGVGAFVDTFDISFLSI